MIKTRKNKLILAMAVAGILTLPAMAEEKKDKKKEDTLVSMLEKKTAFEGFFPVYQDEKDGSTLLVVNEDQLNKPFLYFSPV